MIRIAGLPGCDHFTKNSAFLIGFFCYGAPCWTVWSFSISPCQILLPSTFLFQMFDLHCTLKGSPAIFGPLVLSSIDNTLNKPLTFLTLVVCFLERANRHSTLSKRFYSTAFRFSSCRIEFLSVIISLLYFSFIFED